MSNPRIYMCAFVASHPLRQRTTSKIASYIVLDSAYVHVPSVSFPCFRVKAFLQHHDHQPAKSLSHPPTSRNFKLQDGPYLTPAGARSFPLRLSATETITVADCLLLHNSNVPINCQLAGAKCLDCSSLACLRSTPSGQEDAGFY